MKGIILAGGTGSRLFPATQVISKQLLPLYDKPMVYYPLSTLMLADIRDILIISTPHDLPRFKELLGDGSHLGIKLSYLEQKKPAGIAEAFIIGNEFIAGESVALILGDNIFYGNGLSVLLQKSKEELNGAKIFGYHVKDPSRYGVASFDLSNRVVTIEEKPKEPKSNFAVCGLYFYDKSVVDIAKSLTPSKRGELEITDINRSYLDRGKLDIELLGRGYAWLDTGTFESMASASSYIQAIQNRQGIKVACIEEVAFRMGFIEREMLLSLSKRYPNEYGEYLLRNFQESLSCDSALRSDQQFHLDHQLS